MLKRSVVGPLRIRRKAAAGQLPISQVIVEAIATDTLPRARVVGASATLQVSLGLAFHRYPLLDGYAADSNPFGHVGMVELRVYRLSAET